MIQSSDTHSLARKTAARLGPNHGYRIEGDIARLHADVAVDTDLDVRHSQWALQLWACDAPFEGGSLSGVKIAEATLPLSDPGARAQLNAEAPASLPVGRRDYAMVLVLASGAPGAFDQIHDFANYPARERFVTPHLDGSVGYHVDGDRVVLRAERIRNPRRAGNLSGSLALQLWALPAAYDGSNLDGGTLLANADLGRIAGEHTLDAFEQRAHFTAPAAGTWHMVLMLREWAVGGYVTRDYCTFAATYRVDPVAESKAVAPQPLPAVPPRTAPSNFNGTKSSTKPARKSPQPIVRWPDYERDVSATTPGGALSPLRSVGRISVSHASVEELAALKGLTKKIAQEIVKGRPYTTLDELVRVRGIGPKLLAKLRSSITL